jgi:transposase-like protein
MRDFLHAVPGTVANTIRSHLQNRISKTSAISGRHACPAGQQMAEADAAFAFFIKAYGVKYDRAAKCLTRDRTDLLAFDDFPVVWI